MERDSVTVEPYHSPKETILLSHKWVYTSCIKDFGYPYGWVPYDIIADVQFLFKATGFAYVYDSGRNRVGGGGETFTWSLSENGDEIILDLDGQKVKVIILTDQKMELLFSSDRNTYIKTYEAQPIDDFMKD